ncbi:heme ABC exporter ATP-binding protein CcmA [Thermoflexus sp.]|uniref:heme ABC exporter ATP-binding protein CcmA n=1 Tax=Thermoflexus sp. TaxID=1969742 RepID=UPI0025D07A45|nr:heme ABC exporter ATP-binding protein CcmA [Thermoflexus sp.]MDW8181401.1 heme ABC exporter ATP-binding protein CcmA [Anaerolineae bacterium]MDW8184548.1 heme ABC exporter ATP-binding protein CcmA [Anaerolineae bacterium]
MSLELALQLERISKAFGPRWVLREVSLTVQPGEIVALMGPNGAGKSTLLRVAATLLRPTSGRVRIGDFSWPPDGARIRAQVTLLGHQPWLYPDLNAAENLRFYQRLYGWPEEPGAVDAALRRMGLADRARDPVRRFSRGMLQRLALARAFLSPAPVLLLDEPFTGLDVLGLEEAREAIRELAAQGRAVVAALHDPATADFAHRVVVLVSGRLVAEGSPTDFPEKTLQELYQAGMDRRTGSAAERPLRPSEGNFLSTRRMLSDGIRGASTAPAKVEGIRSAFPIRPQGHGLRAFQALLWKDLRIEGRARETLTPLLTLAGLSLFLFGAAFELRPDLARSFVPVFFWMLLLFASSLGVGRMMASEIDRGTWEGLLMVPGDRSVLFAGKAMVHSLLLGLVILLSLAAAGVFFNLSLWDPAILLLLALGAVGLSGVTTLLAAIAMATRARELLLPILLFPVAAPLVIAGIQGTRAILEADPAGGSIWLQILLAYDLLLFAVAWMVFEEVASS